MAENSYKRQEPKEEKKEKKKNGRTIFQIIESSLGLDKILKSGLPVNHLPKIAFGMIIVIFYIANTHYADKVVRKTAKLKIEVEDLRADYTTLKADLMFKSKQSEVAKKVSVLGLEESQTPPNKIVIKSK